MRSCSAQTTRSTKWPPPSVLSYLLTKNAIGTVSTHDLDLVTHPAIAEGCRAVYFRESFVTDGPDTRMVFDYLMRPGVAPTTNVPFLLKAVGLPSGPATGQNSVAVSGGRANQMPVASRRAMRQALR